MSARILIVDDALLVREMLRDILTEGGFEVVGEARDGIEALERFRELEPDLVVLDIVMPRKSGVDALAELIAERPDAKVLICSALGQEALIEEARSAGALGFIVKPFSPGDVTAAIRRALREKPRD
ncbi:MAG: response regulator [Myxococcales bacterium]|nr:response regulator [Myxococcales bacterium]